MMRRSLSAFAALFLFAYAASGQQPTQAILAGKLIDVRTGQVRTHAYIHLKPEVPCESIH